MLRLRVNRSVVVLQGMTSNATVYGISSTPITSSSRWMHSGYQTTSASPSSATSSSAASASSSAPPRSSSSDVRSAFSFTNLTPLDTMRAPREHPRFSGIPSFENGVLRTLFDRLDSQRVRERMRRQKLRTEAAILNDDAWLGYRLSSNELLRSLFLYESNLPHPKWTRLHSKDYRDIYYRIKDQLLYHHAWSFFQLFQLHTQLRWKEENEGGVLGGKTDVDINDGQERKETQEVEEDSEVTTTTTDATTAATRAWTVVYGGPPVQPRLIGLILECLITSPNDGPLIARSALEWMNEHPTRFQVTPTHYDMILRGYICIGARNRLLGINSLNANGLGAQPMDDQEAMEWIRKYPSMSTPAKGTVNHQGNVLFRLTPQTLSQTRDFYDSIPADKRGYWTFKNMLKAYMDTAGMEDEKVTSVRREDVMAIFRDLVEANQKEMKRTKGEKKAAREMERRETKAEELEDAEQEERFLARYQKQQGGGIFDSSKWSNPHDTLFESAAQVKKNLPLDFLVISAAYDIIAWMMKRFDNVALEEKLDLDMMRLLFEHSAKSEPIYAWMIRALESHGQAEQAQLLLQSKPSVVRKSLARAQKDRKAIQAEMRDALARRQPLQGTLTEVQDQWTKALDDIRQEAARVKSLDATTSSGVTNLPRLLADLKFQADDTLKMYANMRTLEYSNKMYDTLMDLMKLETEVNLECLTPNMLAYYMNVATHDSNVEASCEKLDSIYNELISPPGTRVYDTPITATASSTSTIETRYASSRFLTPSTMSAYQAYLRTMKKTEKLIELWKVLPNILKSEDPRIYSHMLYYYAARSDIASANALGQEYFETRALEKNRILIFNEWMRCFTLSGDVLGAQRVWNKIRLSKTEKEKAQEASSQLHTTNQHLGLQPNSQTYSRMLAVIQTACVQTASEETEALGKSTITPTPNEPSSTAASSTPSSPLPNFSSSAFSTSSSLSSSPPTISPVATNYMKLLAAGDRYLAQADSVVGGVDFDRTDLMHLIHTAERLVQQYQPNTPSHRQAVACIKMWGKRAEHLHLTWLMSERTREILSKYGLADRPKSPEVKAKLFNAKFKRVSQTSTAPSASAPAASSN